MDLLLLQYMFLLSNNVNLMSKTKKLLSSRFYMVDQGEAHYIFRMTIKWDWQKRCLGIGQPKYLECILHSGMKDCNPVSASLDVSHTFCHLNSDEDAFKREIYQAVIGCFTYVMTAMRSDLAFAVSILSQFISNPGIEQWQVSNRFYHIWRAPLLKSVLRSISKWNHIEWFTDTDLASDLDHCEFTSGYIFLLGLYCIIWHSKQQLTVAKSSTEAEYITLNEADDECKWFQCLLTEIGLQQKSPSVLFEDNHWATDLLKNSKFHDCTKHIEVHLDSWRVIFRFYMAHQIGWWQTLWQKHCQERSLNTWLVLCLKDFMPFSCVKDLVE